MSIIKYDNPGGQWLEKHRKYAEEQINKKGANKTYGPATAYTPTPIEFPVHEALKIPGEREEKRIPGDHQYDELKRKVEKEGFKKNSPILIGVNHRGEPHIIEGNTRTAIAHKMGEKTIPAEVKYYAGGEQIKGKLHPDKLHEILGSPMKEHERPEWK